MKQSLEIGPWTIEVDVEQTARVYELTTRGSPTDCGCEACRNFMALSEAAFPLQFRTWLSALGVDCRKAAEVHEWSPVSEGRLTYGGWFHGVGRIVTGVLATATSLGVVQAVEARPWHAVTDTFKVIVDERRDLAFAEFGEAPVIQIEFMAELPWVLSKEAE